MTTRRPLNATQQADASRLKALWEVFRVERGWNQARLAEACGWSNQSAASQYLNGRIPLNLEAVMKFSTVLGAQPAQISPSLAALLPAGQANLIQEPAQPAYAARATAHDADLVVLPWFTVRVSAADGAPTLVPRAGDMAVVSSRAWGKREGYAPGSLFAMGATGDAMAPTIPDGSTLTVLQLHDASIRNGAVYVFVRGGEVHLRRLYRQMDGGLLARSDHRDVYSDHVIAANDTDFSVVGRVIAVTFRL
ncbi:LexA family transcriptional regulator [Chitiniphilus eburneus]|uniref:Helix-turn-helix domain-containing protein n=1 Tax=Chitiniphilus eburneus TaxID=2571148 RepID=A0A4U0PFV6_9NEIS|nr:LexA family transcriptional regulator [Chitiniphilus eburneus]TJZ66823.1 helix-turn-helix domain-containing protein [Chitiniphilus eburneus]